MTSCYSPATVTALIDSLRDDPVLRRDHSRVRRQRNAQTAGSGTLLRLLNERGRPTGHLVVWPDPSVGAAVWLLPADTSAYDAEAKAKRGYLAEALGAAGADTYQRIIDFMRPRASAVVNESAWYLSIVGVTPSAQGQGIGRRLIEPTLADADDADVDCYLETFDSRNTRFYQRLGFSAVASHAEPVTGATYTVMRLSSQR